MHPQCCSAWGGCSVVSSFFLAFVLAFLIHLIPSVAIGVEVALGSSEMHQRMGMIWFGSFPFILAAMMFGRHYYLHAIVFETPGKGSAGLSESHETSSSITVGGRKKAIEVREWIDFSYVGEKERLLPEKEGQCSKSCDDLPWPPVIAFSILGGLTIFAMITGVLIIECQGRGQCYDGLNMTGKVPPPLGF